MTFEKVPCVLMRGGTSRGPFFLENDLPREQAELSHFLLAAMGSPHNLQVDGIGGGNPLTSKVAIVGASTRPGVDVEYLFAQVSIDRAFVDFSPNCGNMLSAVGPFAIEAGLVDAREGETTVRIFNRNTGVLVEAVVQTPGGVVDYAGQTSIDGVAGSAAPIRLIFRNAMGSKTGALLPTGNVREEIDGVPVSLVDYAVPMVLIHAASVGLAGTETPDALEADIDLLARLEAIRLEAGRRMGLGDVSQIVVPKLALLSAPRAGGTLTSRYFANSRRCHRGHAVTGALCIAAASLLKGSIAANLAVPDAARPNTFALEHPGGRTEVGLERDACGQLEAASLVRTARRLFEGNVIVPLPAFAA
ncbi:4-oxalomesaconate tautomerase [Aquabacter sediminis]|uniref:4-oxalomesaconate tautomerase n=1 Tax=Aquabacter sediminis TaxID=3029197 RepID=UPI00237E2D23|nr:4-oxalomesaconate tautomerase [Aquabacter sp. P-9]MDE1570196.1 4-oxalomesaconate tautomerase [Aquabacter sp. P-9]